jgi:sulfate adenylyltransferase subunit 1
VQLQTQQPLPLEDYAANRAAGALIVVDPTTNRTSGALLVGNAAAGATGGTALRAAGNED